MNRNLRVINRNKQSNARKAYRPALSHSSPSEVIKMLNKTEKTRARLKQAPQYFNTDRSKAVLLLWFLTVTCSCCPYLYFGSAIMLVTYFSKF